MVWLCFRFTLSLQDLEEMLAHRGIDVSYGRRPEERLAVRQERSAPLLADLEVWMRQTKGGLSSKTEVAKAMDYMLKRWAAFARFLEDGRICLTNNAAERALRGTAL